MDLLKEQARQLGATVLVVTHDHRLESYADKIFAMADGSLTGEGSASVNADTAEMVPLPAKPLNLERVMLRDYAHQMANVN
jgi:ABC-type lipoprotein export system ATPase subunit